ncbi:MarR family transcriptional regulator [Amycolatopsis sp. NPDC004169]|uniref:MarR family winged helix-turn-helix transcriptional regulator n=1 Tax=Amycolatopsis sp. NPDC004169 TaxID=3154453 RepID=UPI0033A64BA9
MLSVVVEREAPILDAHGVTMWEYVILSQLLDETGLTQKELAHRSRRDPTRLIGHLDALGDRGLISRETDESDRRRRTVRLTSEGDALVRAVRRDVRRMEAELLDGLSRTAQDELRTSLAAVLSRVGPSGSSPGDLGPR